MPWFRVIGDKFDWYPTPRRHLTYLPGKDHLGSSRMIEEGLRQGVIEVIRKPSEETQDD